MNERTGAATLPLPKLPITRLDCDTLNKLADLGPLRGTPLRHLPKLRRLSTRGVDQDRAMTPVQTAEEFWKSKMPGKPARWQSEGRLAHTTQTRSAA